MAENKINIEVAYALPNQHFLKQLTVSNRTSIYDAILHSGVLQRFPEIDLDKNKVGIFGKIANLEDPLNEGDRVEIYRPLIADPKLVRRLRAAAQQRHKEQQKNQQNNRG